MYEKKSFLENGKVNSFEILFRKGRSLEHSPIGGRMTKDGKEGEDKSGNSKERLSTAEGEGARAEYSKEAGDKKTTGPEGTDKCKEGEEDGQEGIQGKGAGRCRSEEEARWDEWKE